KHQSTITIKEIKLRPKIDPHDYTTKKGHVVRFLKNRDKVKVTIMFRGREMTHPERGRALLLKLAEEVQDLGIIESSPLQDGRNMVMMLAPHKNVAAPGTPVKGDEPETEGQPQAEAAVESEPQAEPAVESKPQPKAAAESKPRPQAAVESKPQVEDAAATGDS
ncbi:MAG: translation initiation factor, partial [Gaiellales bacterium]|nr:translation initiation factor [Gaiellales bacterium]